MSRYRSRRSKSAYASLRPLGAFLLLACFGILFAGCGSDPVDEFVISEDDAEQFKEMALDAEQDYLSGTVINVNDGSGDTLPAGSGSFTAGSTTHASGSPVIDLSQVGAYNALRATGGNSAGNVYTVTSEFVNLRAKPQQNAENLARVNQGEAVEVLEFTDAAWAKVKVASVGKEGYVSTRMIGKLTTDDKLAEEKAKFDGMFFVNYAFVNVRAEANQKSAKLGEIPGQSIIKPISRDATWTKVLFQGKEGYVSSAYLSPFLPAFIVRQESYTMPILHYKLGQQGLIEAMEQHLARLRRDGAVFQTASSFRDILLRQQGDSSVRLPANSVLIAITGVTPENIRTASDALGRAGVRATFFIETKQLGITGITEKQVLTLLANGHDVQSGMHTGDDLRALTNAQVELELRQSRKLLEDMTRRSVFAAAYPQGGVNDRVMQVAADAGYLFGIGSGAEKTFNRSQLLKLPSLQIFPTMTADEVAATVKQP